MANDHRNITLTHVNGRQSISMLLSRIIVLDLIAVVCIALLFTGLCQFSPNLTFSNRVLSYNTTFFIILGILKIISTVYIILMWLNDYYEIWPGKIIHRWGLIWKKEQQYSLEY